MSNTNGNIVARSHLRLVVGGSRRSENQDQSARFTPLRRREALTFLLKRREKGRTFSAICFPGWDRG
jgi:hypothetical protein